MTMKITYDCKDDFKEGDDRDDDGDGDAVGTISSDDEQSPNNMM